MYVGTSTTMLKDLARVALNQGLTVITSFPNAQACRDLKQNHAYFIKKDQSRGLDFSGDGGIELLVAQSLPTDRALE